MLSALAQGNRQPAYTVVRRYTLNEATSDLRNALMNGYVQDVCQAPGFIAYFTVEDEDGDFVTIAVFRSQQDFDSFANSEANWIAQNLSDLLPSPDEAISGQTFIQAGDPQAFRNTCPAGPQPTATAAAPTAAPPTATAAAPTSTAGAPTATALPVCTDPSRPGVGCACTTGTQNPCGDTTLLCCANDANAAPGAPGTCTPSSVGCNPLGPTPTPTPCTGQGCVCTTGTQAPCDDGLVCCPTTDRMGGPGVCQTEQACYPNQCTENADGCDATCNWGDACPSCCSDYCNDTGQCDNAPAPCTGHGCTCATGTQSPCDSGLVCCGTTGTPGGPGTCLTDAECNPPCTGEGCACNGGVQGNCDDGLVCCQNGESIPGGAGTCVAEANCAPAPCTGQGCACTGGVEGACDDGLVCCLNGVPVIGGNGGCVPEAQCPSSCSGQGCDCDFHDPNSCDQGLVCCAVQSGFICATQADCGGPCTGQGCDCTTGVQGACDDGLICCAQGDPGAPGTCQTEDACPGSLCTGQGCPCTGGVDGACDDGLICCVQGDPGAPGTCQTEDGCPGSLCTGEGCDCDTGTQSPCQDGLTCCGSTDTPGGPGVCQASC
jgi:hypothetical protein